MREAQVRHQLRENRGWWVLPPRGSPAQAAGLARGDIILDANGKPVAGSNELRMMISVARPDTDVKLAVYRGGIERQVTVKLGELQTADASAGSQTDATNGALSGVTVESLTPQSDRGWSTNTQGVVVTSVSPSSKAAQAGLRAGDVIQEINRHPIHSVRGQ